MQSMTNFEMCTHCYIFLYIVLLIFVVYIGCILAIQQYKNSVSYTSPLDTLHTYSIHAILY